MKKPNVILVITDDQGYGDLGCTGNEWIQTPNIDQFCSESTRLTDFHVAPLCAPTRGGLMSGCNTLRNGVWGTCFGRSILKKEYKTLGNLFAENGYRTGLFGKWHLGDNYPYRPQDRGFGTVVAHKGGGVGQTPDFWGNNYFDDTYFKNGVPTTYDGYCTDVWFDCAQRFIEEDLDAPFFAYISTNAPHSPYLVEERYAEKYRGNENIWSAEFCGMIENIDENFGKLRSFLAKHHLEDDTILIFMTDNGTSGGAKFDEFGNLKIGYNAGLRGTKGDFFDGGHRVPFFIKWNNGDIVSKDVDELIMHNDLFPTFMGLCDLKCELNYPLDGKNVSQTIQRGTPVGARTEFAIYQQRTDFPSENAFAVLTNQYRLVRGAGLYDIKKDRAQKNNLIEQYPQVAEQMLQAFYAHRASVMEKGLKLPYISLGAKEENPTRLDAMDVLGDVAWSQDMVYAALKSCGEWAVFFETSGQYKITLSRWPEEIWADIEEDFPVSEQHLAKYYYGKFKKVSLRSASLEVMNHTYQTDCISKGNAVFTVDVESACETILKAGFLCDEGVYMGAYYAYVEKVF